MATSAGSAPSEREQRPGKFVWFEHVSRDARKAQAFYGEDGPIGRTRHAEE